MSLPNKPIKLTSTQTDFASTIANITWLQAAQLADYVNRSYPIGMLIFVYASQSNIPGTPDVRYWKLMDGTAVSNVDSPLNGLTFPDLRGLYIRPPTTILSENPGDTGGADLISLAHSHTGVVSSVNIDAGISTTSTNLGSVYLHPNPGSYVHNHTIAVTSFLIFPQPLSKQLQVYMRIA